MDKRSRQLEDRTIKFSVNVISQLSVYAKRPELNPLIIQVIKASTSVGANYHEANNASSPADFRSKIFICKKESAETEYWLKVLGQLLPNEDFEPLQKESHELLLIFQKIITTMKDTNGKW